MRRYTDFLPRVPAGLPVPTSQLAPGSALKWERCVPAGEPALGTTRGANVSGEVLSATTQGGMPVTSACASDTGPAAEASVLLGREVLHPS